MNTPQPARAEAGSIAWAISRRLGMVIILALAFFLSALVTIYTLFRSGDTQVPNVVGRSETEAQKLAVQAGLRVKVQRRSDASVPADSVIETRPGPNSSVKKDSLLTIVVSSGPVQTRSQAAGPRTYSPGRRIRARNIIVNTSGRLLKEAMTPEHSSAIPPTELVVRSYSGYTGHSAWVANSTNAVGGLFITNLALISRKVTPTRAFRLCMNEPPTALVVLAAHMGRSPVWLSKQPGWEPIGTNRSE